MPCEELHVRFLHFVLLKRTAHLAHPSCPIHPRPPPSALPLPILAHTSSSCPGRTRAHSCPSLQCDTALYMGIRIPNVKVQFKTADLQETFSGAQFFTDSSLSPTFLPTRPSTLCSRRYLHPTLAVGITGKVPRQQRTQGRDRRGCDPATPHHPDCGACGSYAGKSLTGPWISEWTSFIL